MSYVFIFIANVIFYFRFARLSSGLGQEEDDEEGSSHDYDAWEARLHAVKTGVELWDLLMLLPKTKHARGRGAIVSLFFNTLRTIPLKGDTSHCQYMDSLSYGKKGSKRGRFSKLGKRTLDKLKDMILGNIDSSMEGHLEPHIMGHNIVARALVDALV